jgi:hypothetical protein
LSLGFTEIAIFIIFVLATAPKIPRQQNATLSKRSFNDHDNAGMKSEYPPRINRTIISIGTKRMLNLRVEIRKTFVKSCIHSYLFLEIVPNPSKLLFP